MNIAYHYEAENLHFLIDQTIEKWKIIFHTFWQLLENEKISQVVPFLIAGHILLCPCIIIIPLVAIRGLVQTPCGKINVIMTFTFTPSPSLNVTAVQHRFNTETLILLHFSLHAHLVFICTYLPTYQNLKVGQNLWKSGIFGLKVGH